MNTSAEDRILVIGYGSDLRGDDAIGRIVAEAVARRRIPNVRAISITQLVPELATQLAECRAAIFVDASLAEDIDTIAVRELTSASPEMRGLHAAGPRELLGLASICYDRRPPAWLVAIAASEVDISDCLSSGTSQHIETAVSAIEQLAQALSRSEATHA